MNKTLLSLILIITISDSFGQNAQNFIICPEKNNVVYNLMPNKIFAFVENGLCDSMFLTTDNGHITSNGKCNYSWGPKVTGESWVTIKQHSNKDTLIIGKTMFYVQNIPDPEIKIEPHIGLVPLFQEFDNDINIFAEIISYKIVIIRDTKVLYIKDNLGSKFNKEFSNIVKTLKTSDLIIFSRIKIQFFGGSERVLHPIEFVIE